MKSTGGTVLPWELALRAVLLSLATEQLIAEELSLYFCHSNFYGLF